MHDLVIRGGAVVDGTGAAARSADVAIEGSTIVAVGRVGRGRRELDARGKLVTPGFVDVHTHYDAQVSWDPFLTPSSWHGCTTVVMGSCGVGFAPVRPERREWLVQLMEGVEDIPGSALVEGIRWGWETFPGYLASIEATPHALDFGVAVPHGAVRAYVMDERGAANEPANANDVREMARVVAEAVRAGALGFSTSRTPLHRAVDGRPVPGTTASRDELFAIARAMHEAGSGVFHVAPDQDRIEEELVWMQDLAREVGCTVSFNLNQMDRSKDAWRRVLAALDREPGLPLFAQVAGRAIGIVMALDGTAHPLAGHRTFRELGSLPIDELRARLLRPDVRARILAETPPSLGPFGDFVTKSFHRMFAVSGSIDYEPAAEASVAALAAREGRAPLEFAYDHLAGGGFLYFPLFNYADGSLEPTRALHLHPRTRMGLGDAGAHCGAICDGGMPTFMLAHWTRDRSRGPGLALEHVVRRQTRETAEFFGLLDRGLVAPGYKADLNVIDHERLALEPVEMVRDLPAGGRRLIQRARGYAATIVSGVVTTEDDRPTGALPGRLVRGRQPRVRAIPRERAPIGAATS